MKLVDIKKISHDPKSKGYIVTLKDFKDNDSLEILVGTKDAKQISLAKEGISLPRPSTHDLLLNIVDSFNIKIKKIIITDYKSSTYYSKIVLHNVSMGEIQIDCRPSDGMILSLKSEAPLYINKNLFNVSRIDDNNYKTTIQDMKIAPKISLKKLKELLDQAIFSEEYEIAAKLRDQISELSLKSVKDK